MISLLITILILVLIISVVWWAVGQIPLPPPVRWVVLVILAIVCILVLVSLLPGGTVHFPLR